MPDKLWEDHDDRFYRNLTGFGSLVVDYAQWKTLTEPDATNFCGLTTCSFLCPSRRPENFDSNGWRAQVRYQEFELQEGCDIVGFDSRPKDELGYHHGITVSDQNYAAFPPYTLFRLQRIFNAGEWVAPGGVRPNCRLLLVTATYKFPETEKAWSNMRHKLCEPAGTLAYGARNTYVQGLTDILSKPALTMREEWQRAISWTDRLGIEYTSQQEWEYVTGTAQPAECTPGIRDQKNAGKTPQGFLEDVNNRIRDFWSKSESRQFLEFSHDHGILTLDEVLSVRLYTGPGHQPLNDYLRQLAKLTGPLRVALGKNPAFTFAATGGISQKESIL